MSFRQLGQSSLAWPFLNSGEGGGQCIGHLNLLLCLMRIELVPEKISIADTGPFSKKAGKIQLAIIQFLKNNMDTLRWFTNGRIEDYGSQSEYIICRLSYLPWQVMGDFGILANFDSDRFLTNRVGPVN